MLNVKFNYVHIDYTYRNFQYRYKLVVKGKLIISIIAAL